jgi:hypothetical protein
LQRPAKAGRLFRTLATDPVRVGRALPGEIRQRLHREQYTPTDVTPDWNERLHELLGAPWPCPEGEPFDELMTDIGELLASEGISFGRASYGWYSDADSSMARAVWCAIRHQSPKIVIETGVAHGVTSRLVLEAMTRNGLGHLWSIDLPFPFDHRLHGETGAAVPPECRDRWSYLEGTSRKRLPPLVRQVGHFGLFIHDSLHTARNTLFEMEQAARALGPGGVMVIDDINAHNGFATFIRRHPEYQSMICPPADQIGLFGIAVRNT